MPSYQACPDVEQSSMELLSIYCTVAPILSLVASLAVITSYAFLPNLRKNQNFRYIGYLSLANVVLAISLVIHMQYDVQIQITIYSIPLEIFFFMLGYSEGSLVFWALIFAFNIYNIINNKGIWTAWVSNEKLCLVIGFILPIPLGIILAWSEMGNFTNSQSSTVRSVIYGCFLAALLFIYSNIVVKAKTVMEHESARRLIAQTIGYSIVLTLNLISSLSANLVYESKGCMSESFIWLEGIWYLEGFVDAIVYGMNPVFQRELRAVWGRKENGNGGITLIWKLKLYIFWAH